MDINPYQENKSNEKCPTCNGQGGWIDFSDNASMVECPNCLGSGKKDKEEISPRSMWRTWR